MNNSTCFPCRVGQQGSVEECSSLKGQQFVLGLCSVFDLVAEDEDELPTEGSVDNEAAGDVFSPPGFGLQLEDQVEVDKKQVNLMMKRLS